MKLQESDILKHGAVIKAFKLPDTKEVRDAIENTKQLQAKILEQAKVDWKSLSEIYINI